MWRDRSGNQINGVAIALFAISAAAGLGLAAALGSRVPFVAGLLAGIYLLFSIKVADQWEKVAVLRLGGYLSADSIPKTQLWMRISKHLREHPDCARPLTPFPGAVKKFPLNKGDDGKAIRGLSYKTRKLNISGSHNAKRHQHFRLPFAPSHDNPHAFGAAPFLRGNCCTADAQQFFHSTRWGEGN